MPQLLTALFGKAIGITRPDLEEKILNKQKESLTLEFKQITRLDDEVNENCITKPTIGFLNTINGDGLLILGIESKVGRAISIKPISEGIIKNEEHLRAIITSSLSSIPYCKDFPELIIHKIPIDGGNIFLVEIKRLDDNCVYYSKITDYAYMRRNDETIRLTLGETIDLIARKNFPQIFIYLGEFSESHNELVCNLGLVNEGLESGRSTSTMIGFFCRDELDITLEGANVSDISDKNPRYRKAYQFTGGYPPQTLLIYPKSVMYSVKLKIKPKKNFNLELEVTTHEEKGFTRQNFTIESNIVTSKISKKETLHEFTPYLTLK